MSAKVPETHLDLLEKPVVVSITSVATDGQPYSAIVWRRWDGEVLRIVTDPKSRKYRNIAANPKVSVLALDPQNPYRYLSINGIVESTITDKEQTIAELDRQNLAYTGKEHYFGDSEPIENLATARYVTMVIRPERFIKAG